MKGKLKKITKKQPREAIDVEEMGREEDSPVDMLTRVSNILLSVFPMLSCTSTISKVTSLLDGILPKTSSPTKLREPSLKTAMPTIWLWRMPWKDFGRSLVQTFFIRWLKLLIRHVDFVLHGISSGDFFSTTELFYPNLKTGLQIIRARCIFHINSDKPNVYLEILDCSLHNSRIALKDDCQNWRKDMLA